MTNHETDGDDKEAILINELEDFLHRHEKIFPELVCFFGGLYTCLTQSDFSAI